MSKWAVPGTRCGTQADGMITIFITCSGQEQSRGVSLGSTVGWYNGNIPVSQIPSMAIPPYAWWHWRGAACGRGGFTMSATTRGVCPWFCCAPMCGFRATLHGHICRRLPLPRHIKYCMLIFILCMESALSVRLADHPGSPNAGSHMQ